MEQKKVIAFFPMTIPASGKTVLFQEISQYFKEKCDADILIIQSDKVTQQLMIDYCKNNPNATQEQAFEQSRGPYRQAFENAIKNGCAELQKSKKKTIVIIFDKNHPENALKNPINIVKQYFPQVITIGLIPKVSKEYKNNIFSVSYLVSCAQRAIKRQNHETLIGTKEKVASIVLFFFKFFNKINKNQLPLDKIVEIPFTTEKMNQELYTQLKDDLFALFSQKNPDDMQKNCENELKRFIQVCEQNDLGFPNQEEQYQILLEQLNSAHIVD